MNRKKYYRRIFFNAKLVSPIFKCSRSDDDQGERIDNWTSDEETGKNTSQRNVQKRHPLSISIIKRKYSTPGLTLKRKYILGPRNRESVLNASKMCTTSKTINTNNTQRLSHKSCSLKWKTLRSTITELKMLRRSTALKSNRLTVDVENCENIEELTCSESEMESDSTKHAMTASASNQRSTAPTELELLLALIEREKNTTKTEVGSTCPKRYQRGGFVEQLLLGLARMNNVRAFLMHDHQLKLQRGQLVHVLGLYERFGVHFAQVQVEVIENVQRAYVVIERIMSSRLQVGHKLLTFFDEDIKPYRFEVIDGSAKRNETIFVAPQMLALIE